MPFILAQGAYGVNGYEGWEPSSFNFTDDKSDKGGLVSSLTFWEGPGSLIRAMQITWNTGESRHYGSNDSSISSPQTLTLAIGERISSVSIWGSGSSSGDWPGLRRIKIVTNKNQTLDFGDSSLPATPEQQVQVGSGLLTGVFGFGGDWIDRLGFYFINEIAKAQLTDVEFPDLDIQSIGITPSSVLVDNVINSTSEEAPSNPITYEQESGRVSSFSEDSSTTQENSILNEQTLDVSVSVEADFLDVAKVSEGFTAGEKHSQEYKVTQSQSSQDSLSINTVQKTTQTFNGPPVPANTARKVTAETGKANFTLAFSATLNISCVDGSVGKIAVKGTYQGVSICETTLVYVDTPISASP